MPADVRVAVRSDNTTNLVADIERIVSATTRRSAERVAARARELAPVDTGALRDSIHVAETPLPNLVQVVADVPYAQYVEFGTSRASAQPFLQRALKEEGGELLSTLRSLLGL